MNKFKTCREILLLSYADNNISDEEFVPLYDCYRSKNPDFGYQSYDVFDLENMNSADCKAEFRVEKADLPRLADSLHIPAVFHCKQRSICDGLEGLCVLLRRTSYPCRFSDMIKRFPRPVSVLSLITNEVMDFIYDNHCHLVTEWNRDVLSSVALQQYAETISRKGSPLNNCFGFIDGTVRPISRPGNGQRIVYNGHKRVHGLKFQSIALPNGLIGNIFGPVGKNLNIFTEY
jgi:hypothetical protein